MNVFKQQKHHELLSILLSQHRFHTKPYAMETYSIDLILVVDIPTQPAKILKKQVFPLSMMRKKISTVLAQTYKQALKQIQIETSQTIDNLKYVNNIGGLKKLEENETFQDDFSIDEEVVKHNYVETDVKDLFTINLNTLIYSLQKECGFNVEKYIINDKVFLLLNCQKQNLRRAAVIHQIKKEVIFSEVDIYLNQPLDSKNRPISLNKKFKMIRNSEDQKEQKTEERLLYDNKNIDEELLKKYHRKLGDVQNYTHQIIDEVNLSQYQIEKFQKFMNQYVKLLKAFDESVLKQELTEAEFEYVRKVLNKQEDINQGALKIFKQIKRKKKYFEELTTLVDQSGYKTFQPSPIYTSFFELNKKKKYSDRVKSLFMFKPLIASPKGELELFLRMEKTRLSYLILLEYFRIENFPLYGIEFYTLHNSFQKSGKSSIESQPGIQGGLDGQNLEKSFSVFTPWKSDIKIIRDYLGQSFAYYTFLKNRLILSLMIISPIALLAFLIIILVLPLNITRNSHLDSFVFYTVYAFIILIWLSAHNIRQDQAQAFHFGTLRQKTLKKTPNFGYKSPYVRNLISDSVNQFREVKSIFNRIKQFLGLIFVVALLCIDVGIFYGIRSWSIVLQSQLVGSRLFFEWYTFIPLFIFFMGNHIVYVFGLKRLFKYLTSLQNNPNLQKDQSSTETKCLLFRIGVQLIGPIDLMVVEALGSHSCYDSSCWNAYQNFINVRFIVIFFILLIRFATFLIEKLINRIKIKQETEKDLKEVEEERHEQSKIKQLFIKIIKQYSKKQHTIDIEQEILILVQSALFAVIQPINTLINLLMILLDFYLQRLQILKGARRPINTATSTPNYSILIKVPFYIFCSFNSWMLIVNFQDLEYVNPNFYLFFMNVATKDAMTTLKIVLAFILFCLMLLFEFIFRKIYNNNNEYSELIVRKEKKLANYLYKYKKTKGGVVNNNHKPIVHMGRVKF